MQRVGGHDRGLNEGRGWGYQAQGKQALPAAGEAACRDLSALPSKTELANTRLVEAEVMPNLVTHRVDDLRSQTLRIAAEVAYERVAENQDLVGEAAATERAPTAHPVADIQAVSVVLGTPVGDDDRHVLQRALELDRQIVKR